MRGVDFVVSGGSIASTSARIWCQFGASSFDSTVAVPSTASKAAEAVPRDRPFNPWRVPKTAAAKALVGDVINQVQHYETHRKLRQRKRKVADQVTFEAAVGALVCDLVHRRLRRAAKLALHHPLQGSLTRSVPLSKRPRWQDPTRRRDATGLAGDGVPRSREG